MDIAVKALGGGVLVGLVLLLARVSSERLAGLFVLFPVINLITFFFIGSEEGAETLRNVLKATLIAYPLGAVSTGTMFLLVSYVDYRAALLGGLLAWLGGAGIFLLAVPEH